MWLEPDKLAGPVYNYTYKMVKTKRGMEKINPGYIPLHFVDKFPSLTKMTAAEKENK